MTMLSTDAQVRYLLQWFEEFSELQRSDFLPVLAEKYANKAYVNGIVNSIASFDYGDKPMSLFQCRVKLFKEWFINWNTEQKEHFLRKISEIDPDFAEKLNTELESGVSNHDHDNEVNREDVLED